MSVVSDTSAITTLLKAEQVKYELPHNARAVAT